MPDSDGERILRAGAEALNVPLNDEQISQLLGYLDLLLHWNKAYNLIADAPRPILVARHLLDSLAIVPWLRGECAVDLGTGAGLPGVPLALAQPQRYWWLVDSAGKRIRFLRHVVRQLQLSRVSPVVSRMESWRPTAETAADGTPETPQLIVLRAVAAPEQVLGWVRHLLVPGTALYLMLGRPVAEKLRQLPPGYMLRTLEPLHIPFQEGERHLAIIEPTAAP